MEWSTRKLVTVWASGLGAFFALIVLAFVALPSYGRYQSRQDRSQNRRQALYDANNEVTINSIRIRTFQQKAKIAKQQADIRYITSVGVRRAQDEIAKTLTPLYVQFEMIDALRQIATSGRNSTVVYIPTGANGLPITGVTGSVTPGK